MSTFVLERRYALQLPGIYVDVDSEEMEYVDGGFAFLRSKWFISNAVNTAITFIVGGGIGLATAYFRKQAVNYGARAAAVMFSERLKSRLTAIGVAYSIAAGASIAVNLVFNVLMWAANPGDAVFDKLNAGDSNPRNQYWDL